MPDGCWYDLVERALTESGELSEQPAVYGDGIVRQFRKSPVADECLPPEATLRLEMPIPAWLAHDAPAEPRRRALTPSSVVVSTTIQ